jgi:hypothetical protein
VYFGNYHSVRIWFDNVLNKSSPCECFGQLFVLLGFFFIYPNLNSDITLISWLYLLVLFRCISKYSMYIFILSLFMFIYIYIYIYIHFLLIKSLSYLLMGC